MKYFLIAGEASGDLHASNLMKQLARKDPDARFRYMGGDLMEAVAPGMILHYRETSYMFLDVLFHLRKIFRNMRIIRQAISEWQPDLVVPVDYPGFNMRMAKHAHRLGLRVHYYISPKVWAWKKRRIPKLREYTRKLFVIFPFEVAFFRKHNMEVEYFGNPLVDGGGDFLSSFEGADSWKQEHGFGKKPVVALLAGSRKKEIQAMLPVMLKVAREHPDFQFVVAGAPGIDRDFYEPLLAGGEAALVHEETYALLASSHAAMVTSGTATLETALFGVPQVVLYRTSRLAFAIAKQIVNINFISLVNLILDRGLILEVLQKDLYRSSARELTAILEDEGRRKEITSGYQEISEKLGERGV
jgi:lipid-A-disaccharide synthase